MRWDLAVRGPRTCFEEKQRTAKPIIISASSIGLGTISSLLLPSATQCSCCRPVWGGCPFCSKIFGVHSAMMIKLDFNNAFNSMHRPDMLRAVADRLPICAYCYSARLPCLQSVLFGPCLLSSQDGPQAGDSVTVQHNSPSLVIAWFQLRSRLTEWCNSWWSNCNCRERCFEGLGYGQGPGFKPQIYENVSRSLVTVWLQIPSLVSRCSPTVAEATVLGAPLLPGPALEKSLVGPMCWTY